MAAPKTSKIGQGSKYNAETHKTIVDAIRKGSSKSDAFLLAGISKDVGFDWLRYGRQRPNDYPHYVKLGRDIDEAQAQVRAEMIERVQVAAKGDEKNWTAAAWYLERTAPEEYGKREQVRIEGGETPLVQLNQVILVDGEARAASRALLKRVTGLSTDEPLGLGVGDEPSEIYEGNAEESE